MRSFLTRRLFICFLILLLLIGITIALLPTVLSSNRGRQLVTAMINRNIPGRIEIKNMQLRWGHGQNIEGLVLYDNTGRVVMGFDELSVQASLWQFIKKDPRIGLIEIHNLNGSVTTDENGISNLQYALGFGTSDRQENIPSGTVTFSDVNGKANLFSKESSISLHLSGNTEQNQHTGSFSITAHIPHLPSLTDRTDTSEISDISAENMKEATLQAGIQNFPVELLDKFLSLRHPEFAGFFRALLGETITIAVDKESSTEGLAFRIAVDSPRLKGGVKGQLINNSLKVGEQSTLRLFIDPETVNPFIQKQFSLLKPTALTLSIDELTFPFSALNENAAIDPCSFSVLANLKLEKPASLHIPNAGDADIAQAIARIRSQDCAKTLEVQMEAQAVRGNQPFTFRFQAAPPKPTRLDTFINEILTDKTSRLTISRFPLTLLPSFSSQSESIRQMIGGTVDVDLSVKQLRADQIILLGSAQTEKITLRPTEIAIDNEIKLLSPFVCLFRVEPTQINPYLSQNGISLSEPATAEILVSDLAVPLHDPSKIRIKAEGKAGSVTMSLPDSFGNTQINNILLTVDSAGFDRIRTALSAQFAFPGNAAPYPAFLGRQGTFSVISESSLDPNGRFIGSNIHTQFQTDLSSVRLEGKILPDLQLSVTKPLKIHYELTPEVFSTIVNDPISFTLQNRAVLQFKAEPFKINLLDPDLKSLVIKGLISADSLELKSASGTRPTLTGVDIPWEINSPLNMIRINIKAQAHVDRYPKAGQASVQFLISDWLKDDRFNRNTANIEVSSNFVGLPVPLLSSFISSEDFIPLVGSALDLELKTRINSDLSKQGYWDMVLDSSLLHVKARLKLGEAITLYESSSEAARFRWTLTPEGYVRLAKMLGKSPEKLTLHAPVTVKGSLADIRLPLKNLGFPPEDGKINLSFETTDIRWANSNAPVFKVNGRLHSLNLRNDLQFTVQSLSPDKVGFNLNGKIVNPINGSGVPDLYSASLHLDLTSNRLPISMLKIFMLDESVQNQLQALIGNEIDSRISFESTGMEGPLTAQIKGANGEISLYGRLKNGVLLLHKPFEWSVKVTPELSRSFLQKHFSMFAGALGSEHPLKLTVDPEGFSLPVAPFDHKKLTVGKGVLSLNKIQFRNEGELRTIIGLLKPLPPGNIMIWFTPLYFGIRDEQVTIPRFDLEIAQLYPLALWGQIDLNSNRLDLTLGISEQALHNAFSVSSLDPDYMLQVPLKGKDGSIEFDKKKAVNRISAAVAHSEGSPQGKIFGTLLDLASGGSDGKPPAPTTDPLPWRQERPLRANSERSLQEESPKHARDRNDSSKESKKEKKHKSSKKPGDQLLDEVKKGASSLLDILGPK